MPNSRAMNIKANKPILLDYIPNRDFGKNGDIVFSSSTSNGVNLCIKTKNQWWLQEFKNQLSYDKSIFKNAEFNGPVTYHKKSKVKFVNGWGSSGNISVDGTSQLTGITTLSNDLKMSVGKKIYFDSDQTTSNNYISSDTSGTIKMYVDGENILEATSSQVSGKAIELSSASTESGFDSSTFRIINTGASEASTAHLTLKTFHTDADAFINFINKTSEGTVGGWCVGIDASDSNSLKFVQYPASGAATPSYTSDSNPRAALSNAGNFTITGIMTASSFAGTMPNPLEAKRIVVDNALAVNYTPSIDGFAMHFDTFTSNDSNTSASGTAAQYHHVAIEAPTISATNASVTTTKASTLHISGAPAAGTNQTLTNRYALDIKDGKLNYARELGTDFQWDITGDATFNSSGDIALSADGGNITMDDGTTTIFDMDVDNGVLKLNHATAQIKLSKDANDYATFTVGDTGDLTIATVGDGMTPGTLTLDATGDIYLDADGGDIYFTDALSGRFWFAMGTNQKLAASTGTFTIGSPSDLILDGGSGEISIKDDGVILAHFHDQLLCIGGETSSGSTFCKCLLSHGANEVTPAALDFQKSRGTVASPAAVAQADFIGTQRYLGWDGSSYELSSAIRGDVDDSVANGEVPGMLNFLTAPAAALVSRMVIASSGEVGIGTWSTSSKPHNILSVDGTIGLEERASASTDAAGYGQLWVKSDDPTSLQFTDDDGNDGRVMVGTITAVFGGGLGRATSLDDTWLGIPCTGHQFAAAQFGTDPAAPDTSYSPSSTADDLLSCIWQPAQDIIVKSCRLRFAQGGSTNTSHIGCLMKYRMGANGDLTSGQVVGVVATESTIADYSHLVGLNLVIDTATAKIDLDSYNHVLIAMVHCPDGINSAMTAQCTLGYENYIVPD